MTEEPKAAAVAVLIKRLRRNLLSPHDDDVIEIQSQYVTALAFVAQFLAAEGEKELASKFNGLADAIRQLKNGTVADVVRPTPGGGRGPDSMVRWSQRLQVVKGLFLILGKMKTNEKAVKYIAGEYPVFNRLKRDPSDCLTTSILSWRRRIKDGDVPEGEGILAHYRSFLEQYGGDNRSPAEMFALGKQLLEEAAERTTKAVF